MTTFTTRKNNSHTVGTVNWRERATGDLAAAASLAVTFSAWIDVCTLAAPPPRRPDEVLLATATEGTQRARKTTGKVTFMMRFLEGPKKRWKTGLPYLSRWGGTRQALQTVSIGDAIETFVCVRHRYCRYGRTCKSSGEEEYANTCIN